jgi:hypothetical protein
VLTLVFINFLSIEVNSAKKEEEEEQEEGEK